MTKRKQPVKPAKRRTPRVATPQTETPKQEIKEVPMSSALLADLTEAFKRPIEVEEQRPPTVLQEFVTDFRKACIVQAKLITRVEEFVQRVTGEVSPFRGARFPKQSSTPIDALDEHLDAMKDSNTKLESLVNLCDLIG